MPLPEQIENAQQYCLRWKYHHSNLQVMFAQLLERESFCDVTLACEGRTLRAHKIMLSACSTYFDSIFSKHEEKDPIVILKDVKYDDIKALVEFMYKGEINVENSQLNTLLQTAEELRIKGLAAVSWRSEEGSWKSVETHNTSQNAQHKPYPGYPPQVNRKRKMKQDFNDIYSPKVSCMSNPATSTDDFPSESDEDSQDGMWDTRSHEDVYSESEDGRNQLSNNNASSMCIPTVIEGEGTVNTEPVNTDHHDVLPAPATPTAANTAAAAVAAVAAAAAAAARVSTGTVNQHGVKGELSDVIKMTAYIQQGGRRPHFWETSSTKRVMEAIKNKEIEMKVAAELLGVSYGTLYGRYRDAYGCLKHPYRVREFWHEPPSVEVISRLQRKELSLFKAAEMLNVTVTTLANYLAALNREDVEEDEEETVDSVACAQQALSKNPDITIVKKEKPDDASTSVNGSNS